MNDQLGLMIPVALRARVSSDRQDIDLSVPAQPRALRDYVEKNGDIVACASVSSFYGNRSENEVLEGDASRVAVAGVLFLQIDNSAIAGLEVTAPQLGEPLTLL